MQATIQTTRKQVKFGTVATRIGHRVILYGPGGIGKTTLACSAPGNVAIADLDESLPRLQSNLNTMGVAKKYQPIDGITTWDDLRGVIQADGWDSINTLVIDSLTRAEELCVQHTLATVKSEKGGLVTRLEDYGYGKGYQHTFESFLPLLSDLDRHCREGRNIILICHDCCATVPNPSGEDWLRYEPRLQSPSSGKASIRLRVREWADHVLFIGYDVDVNKEGKGRGAGTKTIWTCELPHCMAKSRTNQNPINLDGSDLGSVWTQIIK